MGTTKWGRPHPARRIRRVCMSTWYCSLQPQIQCHICALEGKLQDILMLQSFPSLREWGSCKIAPKPVGCGDPVVLSGIPGCSDTFLLVDHETSGTINLVCWEGRLCLPVRCQEVIWKWELVINRCWSGAVLPLPCSCHLCDEVVTVTLPTRQGGRVESLLLSVAELSHWPSWMPVSHQGMWEQEKLEQQILPS